MSFNIHLLLAMALFSIYGVQVCPFLETQTVSQLLSPIVIAFALIALCRVRFQRWVEQARVERRLQRSFVLYIGLFAGAGVLIATVNGVGYGAPWHSNAKVLLGMLCLGYFIGCDQVLGFQLQQARMLKQQQQHLPLIPPLGSFVQQFIGFSLCSSLVMASLVFLVVNKDLDWLVMVGSERYPLALAQRYIVTEIGFVTAVILGYVMRVIYSYSRVLKHLLQEQQQVMSAVGNGHLNDQVTVSRSDEFGVIAEKTNQMIASLATSRQALTQTRDIAILSLASLAETRDNETGAHILRTQHYVKTLATHLSQSPQYQQELTPDNIELIYKSAPLHDVGKVGIPDAVLLKPGKLDDEEWAIMRQHPQIGADALEQAELQFSEQDTAFLRYAKEISLYHHERWDGRGYPQGLIAEAIPLSARLMALADVYDALISKRVYKPAFSHDKAKAIILEGEGSHFDPAIVQAFVACEQQFVDIAKRYQDGAHIAA